MNATGKAQKDQDGFLAMLSSTGFRPERVRREDIHRQKNDSNTFLVIPQSSAEKLTSDQTDLIYSSMKAGMKILTDGESGLSKKLKIQPSAPFLLQHFVGTTVPHGETWWSEPELASSIKEPLPENSRVVYATADHRALALAGPVGKGSFLYFGPLFDPLDGRGYARFPSAPNIILEQLRIAPAIRKNGLEVYFDLADRVDVDFNQLAQKWQESGIRAVYVSAWYFDDDRIRYAELIAAAHKNGILAYAWFQWPHVSQRFWTEHPEWREKTATLDDANVDWRLLMNFQNPACLRKILEDMGVFLKKFDWDGINIAEFYFEPVGGLETPQDFTPLNSIAREEFRQRSGFDPIDLFNKESAHYWKTNQADMRSFFSYRAETLNGLQDRFMGEIKKIGMGKRVKWPLIITTMDVLTHPELTDFYAIDMRHLTGLLRKSGARLQLEDEYYDWKLGPDRYTRLGDRYKKEFPDLKFMIDINVVSEGIAPGERFPTTQPTGTELAEIYHSADAASSGVAFYSEYSVYDQDWDLMPYIMGADAK